MELNVLERVLLLNIIPVEGDITTIRIVRKLREALSFSEAEHQEINLTQEGNQIKWEPNELRKEVEIGTKAKSIIAKALKHLSDEGKLPENYVDVYDKFVEEG